MFRREQLSDCEDHTSDATLAFPVGNYVSGDLGNYVSDNRLNLGNYVSADRLLAVGAVFAALGISALVFRAPLWSVYQGVSRRMGPRMGRFQYVISCLVVPTIFAVVGIFAFVLGLVRI